MDSVPEFELKEIRILPELCKESSCLSTPEAYLNEFSAKQNTSKFCLAYLVTFQDFHKGVQGLAKARSICSANANTGFISALNWGVSDFLSDL